MMRRSKFVTALVVSIVSSLLSLTTPAVADWAETFDGGFDQSWNFQGLNAVSGNPSATLTTSTTGDVLQLSESRTASADGANIAFGAVVTEGFSNVLVTGTVNPTNDGFTSPVLTL